MKIYETMELYDNETVPYKFVEEDFRHRQISNVITEHQLDHGNEWSSTIYAVDWITWYEGAAFLNLYRSGRANQVTGHGAVFVFYQCATCQVYMEPVEPVSEWNGISVGIRSAKGKPTPDIPPACRQYVDYESGVIYERVGRELDWIVAEAEEPVQGADTLLGAVYGMTRDLDRAFKSQPVEPVPDIAIN